MIDEFSFEPDQARYELQELLGEGLNAKVYRAIRIDSSGHSRQPVALKFLKDQTSVSFLRREFETLMQVRSSFCARVIAWETRDTESVLAMEWIDGVSLFDFIESYRESRSMTDSIADEICSQIALGLFDLEAAGLFHGDLHPKNVMIDRCGQIRLIDFASGQTADGLLQATPAFAAPEVRSRGALSSAADRFALGVIREQMSPGSALARQLMNERPENRHAAHPPRNPQAQKLIAREIERQLALGDSPTTQVLKIPDLTPNFELRGRKYAISPVVRTAVALCLALMSAVTLPVMAEAPSESVRPSAVMVFSSLNWLRVQINGKDAGYAPLKLTNLRAGTHRIFWESASGRGELKLTLAENQEVHVSTSRKGEIEVR